MVSTPTLPRSGCARALVASFFAFALLLPGCTARRAASPPPRSHSSAQLPASAVSVPEPPRAPAFFTFGSTERDVAAVMGTPERVDTFAPTGKATWYYGASDVTFRNGAVTEWDNAGHNLKVRAPGDPAAEGAAASIAAPSALAPVQPVTPAETSASVQARSTSSSTAAPASYPAPQTSAATGYSASTSAAVSSAPYHYVSGYTRRDGTYVSGHYRTNADSTRSNNWSSSGNVNPFTGRRGYRH